MRRIVAATFAALLLLFAPSAKAQVFVNIISSCGTIPGSLPLTPGRPGLLFIDTNGNLCTGATFTPSGTQNVNLTQILGAAPSLTNPLWVFPATGATFPVSGTFWPYTLGQQLAAASVPVVLTAAQLSTLTPLSTVTANQGTANATPWNDNIAQWAGATLGAATAWGTAPTGNVPGVNANILGPLGQQLAAASIPVVLTAAQITTLTPPTSVTANGAVNVTATDCSATVVTGGSAVNAFTAQTTLHGFTIANIDTTEVMWISFTTTAAASGTGSYPLPAATATTFAGFGSFTAPPGFGLNHALSVVAATNGHKFSCTWW